MSSHSWTGILLIGSYSLWGVLLSQTACIYSHTNLLSKMSFIVSILFLFTERTSAPMMCMSSPPGMDMLEALGLQSVNLIGSSLF